MIKPGREATNDRIEAELVWRMACRKLQSLLPDEVFQKWIDHFKLSEITDEKAVVVVSKKDLPENFLSSYEEIFVKELSWAAGRELKVEFRIGPDGSEAGNSIHKSTKVLHTMKKRRKIRFAFLIFLAFMIAVVLFAGHSIRNQKFEENFYYISSQKAEENIRIIQYSDLYGGQYGKDNEKLVRRTQLLNPDLVIMSGDMVGENGKGLETVVDLCKQVMEFAPVLYVYGDNENDQYGGPDSSLQSALEGLGVLILKDETVTISVKGMKIDVFGALTQNESLFESEAYKTFIGENPDHFKLMVNHKSYYIQAISPGQWPDLILAGHTQGGTFTIPYLGVLYDSEYGFFPGDSEDVYLEGKYVTDGGSMIVSRGLANRLLPCVSSKPELVVVDVNRY